MAFQCLATLKVEAHILEGGKRWIHTPPKDTQKGYVRGDPFRFGGDKRNVGEVNFPHWTVIPDSAGGRQRATRLLIGTVMLPTLSSFSRRTGWGRSLRGHASWTAIFKYKD